MASTTYRLAEFTRDLVRIAGEAPDDRAIVQRLAPLVQRLALGREWLRREHYTCNAAQGFGVHLLHEEAEHRLAVFALAWLPGRGAPPHNHGTWAVVAGVDGPEKNVFWSRVDDGSRPGYAEIRPERAQVFGPGEVVAFLPHDIHSVVNETAAVTVSLHVYGKHLNYTGRSQFDPERRTETPFVVAVQ